MTRVLLAIKDVLTRTVLAAELGDLMPGCSIDEADTAARLRFDLVPAAQRNARPYHTIVLDALLPGTPTGPAAPSLIDEIHAISPGVLVLHLAPCTHEKNVGARHERFLSAIRNLPDGAAETRCERPLYMAFDQTQAWIEGHVVGSIVSQAVECLLDQYPAPLVRRGGSVGPRRRHRRNAAQIEADLGPVLRPLALWCDAPLKRRLRAHFGIELTSPPNSSTPRSARMFFSPDENYFLANQVLTQKADCEPFLLHYLNASCQEEDVHAQRHGIADSTLLSGYRRGFQALYHFLTSSKHPRAHPLFGNTDPPIDSDLGRRIHAIIRNLNESPVDAVTVPGTAHMPYMVLPHEWRCSDPHEPEARGFGMAVHEATHVFNERLLHHLWHHRCRHEWEWLDEATAIFMEATLLETHFKDSGSPLWIEHMAEWVQRPFCPIVDCQDFGFCGRGSHGAMLLRHIARLESHSGAFVNTLWNAAISRAEGDLKVRPAISFFIEAVDRMLAQEKHLPDPPLTFTHFISNYFLSAYSVAATEPRVAEKHGAWRWPRSTHRVQLGRTMEFTTMEPRPLACHYHRFEAVPAASRLRLLVAPQVPKSPVRLGLAWAVPGNAISTPAHGLVIIEDSGTTLEAEVPTVVEEGSHGILVVAHCEPQAFGRASAPLSVCVTVI